MTILLLLKKRTALALFLFLFGTPMVAHTELIRSTPAAGIQLEQSPETLELTFGDPVRLTHLDLIEGDGDGYPLPLDFQPGENFKAEHTHPLPELADGHYTIEWVALAIDDRSMYGRFSFHIGSADMEVEGPEVQYDVYRGEDYAD